MQEKGKFPLIVDIKRHCYNDGPGIRSVVFFKGCPLACLFCQNPESQDAKKEISFSAGKCVRCKTCGEKCPAHAIDLSNPDRIRRPACTTCAVCAGACPAGCYRVIGRYYDIGELVGVLMRDAAFYRHSGGGVTLSGGECTMFPEYLEILLKELKKRSCHVLIETCGHFDYGRFERMILPFVDMVYFDVKIADSQMHEKYCGVGNKMILSNLASLLKRDANRVMTRIPVIPTITATKENLEALLDLVWSMGSRSIELVPYNPMGIEMAKQLGKPKRFTFDHFMNAGDEQEIMTMVRAMIQEKSNRIGE
jgi:pyruvate formate lyase activating enzyme